MKTKNLIVAAFVFITIGFSIPKNIFSQSTDGDSLFDGSAIHDVFVTFAQPGFWDSLVAYYPLDKMMMASIIIDGTPMDSIGIQLKGNSSYSSYPGVKKSMKIGFDEYVSQKFDGLKKINLNNSFKDPTMMREKLMLDFCRRNTISAPRCTYARVYLNNTYWGLYTMVEQMNKTLLSDRFGNNDGNLFKGDPQGTLQWYGSSASLYYPKYELKTNETANDWSDLVHLIDIINNTPSAYFYDSLETVLETSTFIDMWAANILFANLDSYQGSGHNYYLYHDSIDNLFKFITWDVNESFGNFQTVSYPGIETMSALYIPNPSSSRPLMNTMLQNNTYKNNYISTLCNYATDDFTTAHLFPIIDSIADAIRQDVYDDSNKMFTNTEFENNINIAITVGNWKIPGLKSFITNRRNALMNELSAYGCWLSTDDLNVSNAEVFVYPNPFTEKSTLEIFSQDSRKIKDFEIKIYDLFGREIKKYAIQNQKTEILREDLLSGIYFYRVSNANQIISSGKLIIQ